MAEIAGLKSAVSISKADRAITMTDRDLEEFMSNREMYELSFGAIFFFLSYVSLTTEIPKDSSYAR